MFKILKIIFLLFCSISFAFSKNVNPVEKNYAVIEKNNKKGLINDKGQEIIPPQYEGLGWSKGNLLVVNGVLGYREKNMWGLLSLKNKKITPAIYTSLVAGENELIIAGKIDKATNEVVYGAVNSKGQNVLAFQYHNLSIFMDGFIASTKAKDNVSYGYINLKESIIIPFQYKKIQPVSPGYLAVTTQQNKISLYRSSGERISDFELDSIAPFVNEKAIIFKNGKRGAINSSGTVLIAPVYKDIKFNENLTVNVLPFPEWQLLDAQNNLIFKYEYDRVTPKGLNIYAVAAGNKEGLMFKDGHLITTMRAWEIGAFTKGYALVKKGDEYGIVEDNGKVILEPEFDSIYISDEYFIARQKVRRERVWSIFSHSGEKLGQHNYQEAGLFQEGMFPVKRRNYWGFLNTRGQEEIDFQYEKADTFKDGKAIVKYLGNYGLVNRKGDWVIKPSMDYLSNVGKNLYLYRQGFRAGLYNKNKEIYSTDNKLKNLNAGFIEETNGGKYGLLSYEGFKILDTQYEYVSELQEDTIYIFGKEGKKGIVSKSGKILVNLDNNFEELHNISEGFLGVRIDNKYGFVDVNGKLRIANRYDSIGKFSNGLAPVKLRGKWGYVDRIERLVVQPLYDRASNFKDGLAIVAKNGKYGIVNKKGQEVLGFTYDQIQRTAGGRFIITQSKKQGLASSEGKLLITPKYDKVTDLKNGYVIIERNQKLGLITENGINTIPLMYDFLTFDPFNKLYLAGKNASWQTVTLTDLSKARK